MADAGTLPAVHLRAAMAQDRFRIRRWLAEPLVQAWWGSAASAEAEINLAMSSDVALCRIVEQGGVPIGYGHAVDIALWSGPRPDGLAAGTWDVDLFIASPEHRGLGLGTAALALLAEEVFATTLAVACCGVVSIRNEAGVRAYERARFRWQQIWSDPQLGPSWVMLRERPA